MIRTVTSRKCDQTGLKHESNTKPTLRVLQVFCALGVGGGETWLLSLLKYFRDNEHRLPVRLQIDVLLTSGQRASFDDEVQKLGSELFYIRYSRRNLGQFAANFRSILRHRNYSVIH